MVTGREQVTRHLFTVHIQLIAAQSADIHPCGDNIPAGKDRLHQRRDFLIERSCNPLCSPGFIPFTGFKQRRILNTAVTDSCRSRYPPIIPGTGREGNLRVIGNAGDIFPHARIGENLLKIRVSCNLNPCAGLFFTGRGDDPGESQQIGCEPKRIFNMIDTHFRNLHIIVPFCLVQLLSNFSLIPQ